MSFPVQYFGFQDFTGCVMDEFKLGMQSDGVICTGLCRIVRRILQKAHQRL
ncbi:hypothetical protein DPMN_135284 [Dreissena polymorpha]|uniref:Uncharacterized protein n=1 Tax=Dreissena polymorpha TaxID=45954 RepID=A0A9D4G0N4_DREPO|nr:hypothetical protein DPMN_135284 [Dreissena polymorpha]